MADSSLTTNVHSLNDDCLGLVMDHFPPEIRASTLPLVCKEWQRVENERPYRPKLLDWEPQDMTASFLAWHLRDTSRLEGIRLQGLGDKEHLATSRSEAYDVWVPKLFGHLQVRAPLLYALHLRFTNGDVFGAIGLELLPLISGLSQLEIFSVTDWEYTKKDAASFHLLARLQKLKKLHVGWLKLYEQVDPQVQKEIWRTAAHRLQESVHSLQLEALYLINIDFLCNNAMIGARVPARDVGSLTKLRTLEYEGHTLARDQFPLTHRLVNLTSLNLRTDRGLDLVPQTLAALTGLKELAIGSSGPHCLHPVRLPVTAEVTKLEIDGALASDRPLAVVLPIQTLRHVRSLKIRCHASEVDDVSAAESPTGGKLTSLTKLTFQLALNLYDRQYILPEFVTEVKSLRVLRLTTGYAQFDSSGEEYALRLRSSLPRLSELRVVVKGVPKKKLDRLKIGIVDLGLKLPRWMCSYSLERATGQNESRKSRYVFTVDFTVA